MSSPTVTKSATLSTVVIRSRIAAPLTSKRDSTRSVRAVLGTLPLASRRTTVQSIVRANPWTKLPPVLVAAAKSRSVPTAVAGWTPNNRMSSGVMSDPEPETAVYLFDDWFDPIEAGLRDRVREFIHAMVEGELDLALARPRYGRRARPSSGDAERAVGVSGHRHGHRSRSLLGTFGRVEIEVPRARLNTPDDKTTEWKSQALRAYQRRTLAADALIASTYLAGTNTRRVRRALAALFDGAVGKDTVSRVWRKVKSDWDTWNARSLAEEPIVRLILDGTAARVPRPGAPSSTISSRAASDRPSSSSSTARRGSRRRLPPSGTVCRSSGAPFTSIAISSRTRPSACTTRSPPTTPT